MERPIDARLLLYVIVVAEERCITRAAKTKLYIAPGSLARDIRNLEKKIGYPLFVRHRGGVTLTRGGEVFVEEARESLEHSQRAADRGAAASRGETGSLVVGFTPLIDTGRLIEVQRRFAEIMPDVVLQFKSAYCSSQIGLVLREVLDAGLIIMPPGTDELVARCVWRTRLVVAVPEALALSGSGSLSLHELSGVPAVWLAREVNTALYDRLAGTCRNGGCLPNIVRDVLTYDEMLDAIASGLGIGFIKESSARGMQVRGVVFRELTGTRLNVEVGVVNRPDKASRSLQVLLAVLAELSDCDEEPSLPVALS